MKTRITLLAAVTAAALAFGCDRDDEGKKPDAKGESGTNTAKADNGGEKAGEKGTKDDDHHGHTHSGERHDLGEGTAGDYKLRVAQVGHVEAGEEVAFEITLDGGGDAEPKAVRAWLGTEEREGSAVALATKQTAFYDADIEVPADLPANSKLWVEVETDLGKHTASFRPETD